MDSQGGGYVCFCPVDTQVYCSTDLSNPQEELRRITACLSDIRTWMVRNKLKINDDKTEFLILYSSYKEFTTDLEFEIGQTKIKPSKTCRNLGVMFDSNNYEDGKPDSEYL